MLALNLGSASRGRGCRETETRGEERCEATGPGLLDDTDSETRRQTCPGTRDVSAELPGENAPRSGPWKEKDREPHWPGSSRCPSVETTPPRSS